MRGETVQLSQNVLEYDEREGKMKAELLGRAPSYHPTPRQHQRESRAYSQTLSPVFPVGTRGLRAGAPQTCRELKNVLISVEIRRGNKTFRVEENVLIFTPAWMFVMRPTLLESVIFFHGERGPQRPKCLWPMKVTRGPGQRGVISKAVPRFILCTPKQARPPL